MEKQIDWEQRRYEAAVQILAGIYANGNKNYPGSITASDLEDVENAVVLAEKLISVLADPNRASLYNEQIFTNAQSECSAEKQSFIETNQK